MSSIYSPLHSACLWPLSPLFVQALSVFLAYRKGRIKSRSSCIAALAPSVLPPFVCLPVSCVLSHRVAVISISISFQFHYGNMEPGGRETPEWRASSVRRSGRRERRDERKNIGDKTKSFTWLNPLAHTDMHGAQLHNREHTHRNKNHFNHSTQ